MPKNYQMDTKRSDIEEMILGRWLMQQKAHGIAATPELTFTALEAIRITLDCWEQAGQPEQDPSEQFWERLREKPKEPDTRKNPAPFNHEPGF